MVDLKVLICARCARVLTGGDQGTEVTRSELTGSSLQTGDFESASQIGGHASFPQWEAGSAVGENMIHVLSMFLKVCFRCKVYL